MPHIYDTKHPPARDILSEHGITQMELSRRSGVPASQFSRVLLGQWVPSEKVYIAVSEATGITDPRELFDIDMLLKSQWFAGWLVGHVRFLESLVDSMLMDGGGRDE